jgi:mannosyltransferase OCH1-like enzyme
MNTWRQSAAEGFDYQRYDDSSAREFIQRHFDQRTEEAFLTCAVPAMRADFFRICALLVSPGIYVDADTRRSGIGAPGSRQEPSAPLFPLYQRLSRGLLFRREVRVANGFMIVKHARDPLLLAILARAIRNIENRVSNNVYLVTGPGIATKFLIDLGEQHEYFRGFELWTQDELLPYMRMIGRLPYKQTNDHWLIAQKSGSIFAAR